ncbi:poly-gamma-glutamate synthesis protein (capsule biosynthesis protein) [Mobilisporobacter senegalensis]|uniref:Poly-gamma-glutamate synthesis protein (Capsule biosynthesis protein) n=1 Tax=Mobilisporobacter senegalensis TaxID=1329262 RepID=A0A3N1XRQ9_9FIRM|nr:CapA family protein [Mobilisporobacter senegalensis]ROR29353.1 poly-gamma-glutamate synthesis protein (capsule biosynthesis protein) [Mobilisporobacter senegalensis]
MSKKKFALLLGFMIFSLLTLSIVIGMEVINYFNTKDNIQISDTPEKNNVVPIEENIPEIIEGEESDENISEEENSVEEPDSPISLAFAGDVLLSNHQLNQYDKGNNKIHGILSKDLADIMLTADIMMVNQEFPFSSRGTQAEDKQYTFRVDPERVNILSEMGIDIVTLANNHTLDYGIDALLDSIDTLDRENIKHVGAGRNLEEAKLLESFELQNKKIAFLGASRVIPVYEWNAMENKPGLFTTYDPALLLDEIKAAKQNHDIVVVYVHWGIERAEYPKDYQRNMGKLYIEAGADVVIGAHPHVLQGIEYYRGKPIVYSLGNFVFGTSTFQTMVLKTEINTENEIVISIIPCQSNNGYTTLKDKKQWKEFYKYMEQISFNVTIDENGVVHSKE